MAPDWFARGGRARIAMAARALAFLVLQVGASIVLRLLARRWVGPAEWQRVMQGHPPPGLVIGSQIVSLLLAALLTMLLVATERGRAAGLSRRVVERMSLVDHRARERFWSGAGTGAAALSALMGLLVAAGAYHVSWSWGSPVGLLEIAAVCALAGFGEEVIFRGYLLRSLTDAFGFWPACVLTSLLFGVAHATGADTLIGSVQVVLVALFFCATVRITGSLWFAIGVHMAWDFAQSGVFGTPDSGLILRGSFGTTIATGPAWLTGGSAGPEGSAPGIALIAAMWLVALAWPRRRGRPDEGRLTA